ncbi:MAG: acetyltransferase [Phycisphaerales bacterium]|nr:acetyltransferase [Phycisphaerales bacterium]
MSEGRQLCLLGGGGHALVVADAAQAAGWHLLGFCDDRPEADLPGVPRLGALADAPAGVARHIAIGDLRVRRGLMSAATLWATIVHPSVIVSPTAEIGEGTFLGARAVVQGRTALEAHVIVNTGAIIEHDCVVGDNTHIAPGAILGGNAAVGSDTLVGLGARVLPGVRIGRGVTVGAGAVVCADVADGATVVGVPARVR